MASARVKAGGWKVRACVRNSYFSMVHTALRPLHRKIRPKTTKRMGQVPPSRTGQPMESSTNLPGVSGCSATKATPPLPIFMVWPEPAATGTPWSAVLYRRSRSMAKRRLPRLSCPLVLGFMDRFLRRFSPPKVHFRGRIGPIENSARYERIRPGIVQQLDVGSQRHCKRRVHHLAVGCNGANGRFMELRDTLRKS